MPSNKWIQPEQAPPPLFLGKKERDLVKQVNDELIERVIGQQLVYYPIDVLHTNYHSLYGEAIEKTFLPPIRVYALINWEGKITSAESFGVDEKSSITVHFHKRRLTEDQDLFARVGDFVGYGDQYYEIVSLNEPRQIFGQIQHKMELLAKCVKARSGLFNAK